MTEKKDYLVLPGVLHRVAVERRVHPETGHCSYMLQAWSPNVLHGNEAECALSGEDVDRLIRFLEGEDAT